MRKTIITLFIILAVAGSALAVDLFPTINVTVAQKTRVYKAVASLSGYYEGTEDARVTDPDLWTDTAAIAAHVRAYYIDQAKAAVRASELRQAQQDIPEPADIGIVEAP